MTKTIAHIVTNIDHYLGHPEHATGLWLTELTHAWHIFELAGYRQIILSPAGGSVPLEPRALKWPLIDRRAKDWLLQHKQLLENTLRPQDIEHTSLDAIYFTGGHGVMTDFIKARELHKLTAALYENGKVVAAVCHGYCGLLGTRLSDGNYLLNGKKITGFSWSEEKLAGVAEIVAYNAEELAKKQGALYSKAALPFMPYALRDGNLITGQNPASAKKTARLVAKVLG